MRVFAGAARRWSAPVRGLVTAWAQVGLFTPLPIGRCVCAVVRELAGHGSKSGDDLGSTTPITTITSHGRMPLVGLGFADGSVRLLWVSPNEKVSSEVRTRVTSAGAVSTGGTGVCC